MQGLDIQDVILRESDQTKQYQIFITGIGYHVRLEGQDCDFTCDVGSMGTLKHYRKNKLGCFKFTPTIRAHIVCSD